MTINAFEDPISDEPTPETEELYSSWALAILCVLLILSLWTSYYVQIKRIRAVHETVLSIFAGMFVGMVVWASPGHLIRDMLKFKHTLFFNLLLPPIILNSGYELKQDHFFRNFGSILTFAFIGTFLSAIGIGVIVNLFTVVAPAALAPKLTLLECLILGSTLSATDPVTILAIFTQYKVDPNLYAVIFGESILNDAVSIVMYETLSGFHGSEFYPSSLIHGTGIFLLSFSISMALGVMFGLGCSLALKHSSLSHFPGIESCLVALVAYTSYFFSNGIKMSGIVSLLFCGITLKHYAYHTMSRKTQRTTKYMFSVLAQLSENFIFIYLGLNLFTQDVQVFRPLLILVTTIAVIATRYLAVFPLSTVINFIQRARGQRHEELPHSYQMMLFWAGLRGAVGVALSNGFQGDNAAALRTTVLVVVVLTVIMFGGTTSRMLEVLGIRTGVEEEGSSSEEEGPPLFGARRRGGWLDTQHDHRPSPWTGRAEVYGWDRGTGSPGDGEFRGRRTPVRSPSNMFSAGSDEESYSDGGEVLPLSSAAAQSSAHHYVAQEGSSGSRTPAAGEWSFTTLDERYLLPLFSNSVASRSFNARKAGRRAAMGLSPEGGAAHDESEDDDGGSVDDLARRAARDFTGA
ncbi:Sodium/hydrogen exchanger family-domain-containing protein [Cantharellus anzutake]|uniref:Sodium/hydrogen exchanger family-domain-containing protein n=1 Tax=Cantharellus anzutake TaxID=1750568 RepID=UPI001905D3D5|nr:Sodium/hydrogen exchanger family-domain-containing protein [Cantharellus anzutake]KAF8313295.1 Sodium/hydrogen exchanger family-domain-containing protein [Cantharellus anzutake]